MRQWLKRNILNLLAVFLAAVQVWQNAHKESSTPAITWKIPWGWFLVGLLLLISALLNTFGYKFRRGKALTQEEQAAPPPPDTTVKDHDPKLEIRFVDDRFVSISKDDYAYFEFINRGRSDAKFACMERFQIGGLGYGVKLTNSAYEIPPDHSSKTIYLEVEKPENQEKLDIFDAFYKEWEALKRPQLDSLKIQIKVTYQDAVRNLFETRCDLVFSPVAHFRKNSADKVIEIKNHKFRKVAAAIPRINWENS